MPGAVSIAVNANIAIDVVNPGTIQMSVTFIEDAALDALVATILLDVNGNPILDVNGQYIYGSTS
jgi:hypothetical protein